MGIVPTLSDIPPIRTHAVIVVVVVVVNVTRGRNAKKNTTYNPRHNKALLFHCSCRAISTFACCSFIPKRHPSSWEPWYYFRSLVLQAIDIRFTSVTNPDQYPADFPFTYPNSIESSMKNCSSSQYVIASVILSHRSLL